MSMPEASGSPGSVKLSSAPPPPKSSRKMEPKFWLIWANFSSNCSFMWLVRSVIRDSSSPLDFSASPTCWFKNPYRSETS